MQYFQVLEWNRNAYTKPMRYLKCTDINVMVITILMQPAEWSIINYFFAWPTAAGEAFLLFECYNQFRKICFH